MDNGNPQWLQQFIDTYQNLAVDNVENIRDIYHAKVTFQDPLHRVDGLSNLLGYFHGLYTNLSSCDFVITHHFANEDEACIYWHMTFIHSKLNGAKPIKVEGHSHLKGKDDKVIYHRDYLDVGAMLYEHIPLLGAGVRFIKKRASQ